MSGVVHGSFTVRREYPAPVAMVFNAWADKAAKAKWFAGPEGWQEVIRDMDFRPGGKERTKGRFPNGRESDFDCEYRDIVPNERIVYVYDMYVDGMKISVSLATVTFEKTVKGTRLTMTEHGVFLDGYDDAGGREHGTNILMDQLGKSLSTD